MLQVSYRSGTVIGEAMVQNSTLEVQMLRGDFDLRYLEIYCECLDAF